MKNKMKQIEDNLRKTLKTDDDKINFCLTMLGCAASEALFIFEHKDFLNIPDNIQYSCTLSIVNVMALEAGRKANTLDLGKTKLPPREKLLQVLRELIEIYKDEL